MALNAPSSTLTKLADQNPAEAENRNLPTLAADCTSPTATQIWGPFYVQHAPFRAKISPITAVGAPLMIRGCVYGLDTRRPLAFASMDIWHASAQGQYDYHEDDPNVVYEYKEELNTHGRAAQFDYRGRLVTDEYGQYEYETVKPAPYHVVESDLWRCPHIHYYVQASGYQPIVTQLYFKGEEKNDTDLYIQESNTIELKLIECNRADGSKFKYYYGEFDIIMAPISSNDINN